MRSFSARSLLAQNDVELVETMAEVLVVFDHHQERTFRALGSLTPHIGAPIEDVASYGPLFVMRAAQTF